MHINELVIENFKGFKGRFKLHLNETINVLVGDNEAGKSTILEAIHLVLSGIIGGHHIKNILSQYLFNNETVNEYLKNLVEGKTLPPPHVLIELYLGGEHLEWFEGNNNSKHLNAAAFN